MVNSESAIMVSTNHPSTRPMLACFKLAEKLRAGLSRITNHLSPLREGYSRPAAIIRKGGRRDWSWVSGSFVSAGSGLGSSSLFSRKPELITVLT